MRLNKSPVRAGYQAVTGLYWVGSLLDPPFFAHTGFVVAIFTVLITITLFLAVIDATFDL